MITVLGSSGFIGSHIVKTLAATNVSFYAPNRTDDLRNKDLGDVIYCIGMTADFRKKPFETVDAHIGFLQNILKNCQFNSITYLSSSRVYIHNKEQEVTESDSVLINANDPDDLYNLTKLTGERLCLSSNKKSKIARISNVFSPATISNSFLLSIISEITATGKLTLYMDPASSKDYILIDDIVSLLIQLATDDEQGIYNLSSGINTSVNEIISEIKKYIPNFATVNADGKPIVFPRISNKKITAKFNYKPQSLIQFIPQLLKYHSKNV